MTRAMPPGADKTYFELFGLPVAYDLDPAVLAARYRQLAREAHPDRYASGSDAERRAAMQTTTLLNEAFRVLKEPVTRASYLLELRGPVLSPGTVVSVDPEFLVEQMELRERLDDARGDAGALAALSREVQGLLAERERVLGRQLTSTAWQPQQALRTVQEMQFLDKLRRQLVDQMADLEDDINQ